MFSVSDYLVLYLFNANIMLFRSTSKQKNYPVPYIKNQIVEGGSRKQKQAHENPPVMDDHVFQSLQFDQSKNGQAGDGASF